jgi:hypothetical protein
MAHYLFLASFAIHSFIVHLIVPFEAEQQEGFCDTDPCSGMDMLFHVALPVFRPAKGQFQPIGKA